MKKIYQLAGLAMLAALSACGSNDDNWTPGEDSVCENQVYFVTETPEDDMVEPNKTKTFNLVLSRESSEDEITVPLTAEGSDYFEVPSSVTFAAGEATANLAVTFLGSPEAATYTCTISIPEGVYNSPYTSLTPALTLTQTVAEWKKLHDLKVSDYYNVVPAYTAELQQLTGTNLYKIVGFMKDYDFIFRAASTLNSYKGYAITPEDGEGSWYSSNVWYFGPNLWNDEYTLYHPTDSTLTWMYTCLWIGASYDYISFEDKYVMVCLYGYGYVNGEYDSTKDLNYDYLYFDWE